MRAPQAQPARTAVVYTPVLEAILSLSVLAQPNHHPLHHEWVRATRRRLPPVMKQRLADFGFSHMDYIPSGLLPAPGSDRPGFEDEMRRIHALPAEEQSGAILRNVTGATGREWPAPGDSEAREEILERSADLGSATVELVRLGMERPAELAEGFLDGVRLYWDAAFRAEWEQTEPKLAAAADEAGELLAERGIYALLSTLRPRVGVNEEAGEFWIRRAHEELIELGPDAEILFVPSAFLWPHIGLVHDLPGRIAVVYPAPFAAYDHPPELVDGFVPLMRALGDPTRLRALKLIAEHPRSNQELAKLIGISDSAMSKHLHQLADSGVVSTRRDGYYLLYELRRGRIEPLSEMLLEFLESG